LQITISAACGEFYRFFFSLYLKHFVEGTLQEQKATLQEQKATLQEQKATLQEQKAVIVRLENSNEKIRKFASPDFISDKLSPIRNHPHILTSIVRELDSIRQPLWVRQQMVRLEKLVIRDVLGSTEAADEKGILYLGDLNTAGLLPRYLTFQQITLLRRLKEDGNVVAHPANISEDDFECAIKAPGDTAATCANKRHLIQTLFRLQSLYPD
jgi:hypothetical protein